MTDKQKREVKQTARKLYRAGRITLAMAVWAMKNAGYTKDEDCIKFINDVLSKEKEPMYGITG